jgi:predicted transcriptional regulator
MMKLFLREKPVALLLCLKRQEVEWNLSMLVQESKMTYVYLMELIPKLKSAGIILEEKKGKRKFLKLTEKGLAIASLFEELKKKEKENVEPKLQTPT